MLHKHLLRATLGFAFIVAFSVAPRPASAQLVPVFDGANFSKNTLTEIHTLQQVRDDVMMKYYQYKQMISQIQSGQFSWQDLIGQLKGLQADINKDEKLCADLQYNNQYFIQKFPGFMPPNDSGPCDAGNLTAANDQLNNITKALGTAATQRETRARQTQTYRQQLNSSTTLLDATKRTGALIAQVADETAAQQQMQAATIQAEAAYFRTEIAKEAKDKKQQKVARSMGYFFKTHHYCDPQDPKAVFDACVSHPNSPPPTNAGP